MSATVNINGRIFDQEHALIPVFDHGFLYGDGIYETLRTYNRRVFLVERHLRRLHHSAEMLALRVPLSNDQIAARIAATIEAAGLERDREAYIRIIVTRGVGDLTYDPAATPDPSVVVIVKPHIDLAALMMTGGVKAALVPIVRNHPGSVNPLIKSNNLLNSALAMQEAVRRGAFEGIMRNYRGELAEGSTSNLFVVRDGAALTPPLESGLLPGITREYLLEIGPEAGVPVRERVLRDPDLFDADECFLTSTTREIVPIVQVDDRVIGSGKPGPVTNALLSILQRKAHELTQTAVEQKG